MLGETVWPHLKVSPLYLSHLWWRCPTSTAALQSDSFPLPTGTSRCETSGHLCERTFQTRALRAPASLISYVLETQSAFAV